MPAPADGILDVGIVGGGASGTALLYALARYTNIERIALVEKYAKPGQVNSRASNNSQTLHVGDIETNYSIDKVRQVKPAAMMVARYAHALPHEESSQIIFTVPKMVLGVGEKEVSSLERRHEELKELFPDLKKLSRAEIAQVEPAIITGRPDTEPINALFTKEGYAVNFERLAQSFVDHAEKEKPSVSVRYNTAVETVTKSSDGTYELHMKDGTSLHARTVVFDADSYSLLFAKQLGYGKHYSLIPIAGTFYFSKKILNGKVYTVQEPRLPFAAVHGDPDVLVPNVTRWGPTARFHPVLESYNFGTSLDYVRSSGLNRFQTWISFAKILLDPIRFRYLLENMLYELPWIGKRMFIHNARKIAPSIKSSDITVAKGYGGMRLQRVDTNSHELQLGEGKIVGDNILFNMTPSPGASVCLYNAMRDAEQVVKFLNNEFVFDQKKMEAELITEAVTAHESTSLPEGYAS